MTCLCAYVPGGMICLACALARGTAGVSFDEYGERKAKRTQLAKCHAPDCIGSNARDGFCLRHYNMFVGTRR